LTLKPQTPREMNAMLPAMSPAFAIASHARRPPRPSSTYTRLAVMPPTGGWPPQSLTWPKTVSVLGDGEFRVMTRNESLTACADATAGITNSAAAIIA
jgi:hypothetical protein